MASEMIRDAVAATRWYWPNIPPLGMITFVDADKIREKEASQIGRCYQEAGFYHCGFTQAGLWAFQMLPEDMPDPEQPNGVTGRLELSA